MRRLFTTIIVVLTSVAIASAQSTIHLQSSADETVVRWDNTTAPHSNYETKDEQIVKRQNLSNTSQEEFYIFKANPAKNTGAALIIFPGGGYKTVNMSFVLSEWLREQGITSMVVKYRLPNMGHFEATMEDGMEAVRYLRANAERLGVDPCKIGVSGSSAGGHLAAAVSNLMPDDEKPAFAILFYPRITGTTWTHRSIQTSFHNLLGADRTPAEVEQWSCENMVTEKTPQTMLLLSDDDLSTDAAFNSARYYLRLKYFGIKSSMHIFPSGGHGWVGNRKFKYTEDYRPLLLDFIANLK